MRERFKQVNDRWMALIGNFMVRSKESFASPSPSAMGCTHGSDGPILFVSTAHAGQINPLLSIGGELGEFCHIQVIGSQKW